MDDPREYFEVIDKIRQRKISLEAELKVIETQLQECLSRVGKNVDINKLNVIIKDLEEDLLKDLKQIEIPKEWVNELQQFDNNK